LERYHRRISSSTTRINVAEVGAVAEETQTKMRVIRLIRPIRLIKKAEVTASTEEELAEEEARRTVITDPEAAGIPKPKEIPLSKTATLISSTPRKRRTPPIRKAATGSQASIS